MADTPLSLLPFDRMDGREVLTPSQMAAADRVTINAGTPGFTLMERAGLAVADDCVARFPHGTRVLVLCGPGNNGGDGFVAARKLSERGFSVRLALLGELCALKGDARLAAERWQGEVLPATAGLVDGFDIIIDALFGAGLSRPLKGEAAALIAAINAARKKGTVVVSVDLPSGIDGETGQVTGAAVEADRTVAFFRKKPGHLLLPGRDHVGRLIVTDIGLRPSVFLFVPVAVAENGWSLWGHELPGVKASSHKYSRGAALVYSGPARSCGAARLAAVSALRIGAGLVQVASPPDALAIHAAFLAALVLKPVEALPDFGRLLLDPRLKAVVIGPGSGVSDLTEAVARHALVARPDLALVLDADVLTRFAAGKAAELFAMIRRRKGPVVLTPHEGEFRRLFADIADASKVERARRAARLSGAVIIYKGADSVIAAPSGEVIMEGAASHWLATAGSGDVLAGAVAGLLAQGMTAFAASAAAVHIHGRAGHLGGRGLVADDLPFLLPRAVEALASEAGER